MSQRLCLDTINKNNSKIEELEKERDHEKFEGKELDESNKKIAELRKANDQLFNDKPILNDPTFNREKSLNKFWEIRKQCMDQIHPKGFEDFKNRLGALQDYIKECKMNGKEPNLHDAFPKMYPLMAPFVKVFPRETLPFWLEIPGFWAIIILH